MIDSLNYSQNKDRISEEVTEEEIIDNYCIDEDDEEYIEDNQNQESEQVYLNQNLPQIQEESIINEKEKEGNNIKRNRNNQAKTKFQEYYYPKFELMKKKLKKTETVKTTDDLFNEAFEKNKISNVMNQEYNNQGNTMSKNISDNIYDKYVYTTSKNCDILSKMKDEEVLINRESKRTKDDAKKINNMLNRAEKLEKLKQDKLKMIEKEMNQKINQECVFSPNGVSYSTRSPKDFYNSQLRFIAKKENKINKMTRDILGISYTTKSLTSKISEKLASAKNSYHSPDEFYKRLYKEKLKTIKEEYKNPQEEKKLLTKEQINKLSNKLHNEGKKFKKNLEQKEKEKIIKETEQKKYISDKSNQVILERFISFYKKVLTEMFDKFENFEITFNDYKLILTNMGCIDPNSQLDGELVKESFYNFLSPKEDDKIDTYSFFIFGLTILGIYKGKDKIKENEPKFNNSNKKDSINEIIKIYFPDLDLDIYGYSTKTANLIKSKFQPFVKGLNSSWIEENSKKKQDRKEKIEKNKKLDKLSTTERKRYTKTGTSKNKESEKILPKEDNKDIQERFKLCKEKREKELKTLKDKIEAEKLSLCPFQPNINKKSERKIKTKNISKPKYEMLYEEGKEAYIKRKNIVEKDLEDNEDNHINCTFKPVIHEFKNEVFNNNPLKEEIKKFEKVGEQRLNNKKNKDFEKPMNFVIESKLNKEDIIDRVIPNKIIKNNNLTERENAEKNIPMLEVEVNLDQNGTIDNLIIYYGENIKEKTRQFCQKHKLNEDKYSVLLNIISNKLKEKKMIEKNNDNIDNC